MASVLGTEINSSCKHSYVNIVLMYFTPHVSIVTILDDSVHPNVRIVIEIHESLNLASIAVPKP